MKPDFRTLVISALRANDMATKQHLTELIETTIPGLSKSTINWKLHQLKSEGAIQSPRYGVYSLKSKADFVPTLSSSSKRLFNRIIKEYPEIEVCVWESKWFTEQLTNEQNGSFIIAEVQKEFTDKIFDSLTDWSKKVFRDPSDDIFNRYIIHLKDAIIIKPIITESPCIEIDNVRIPSLEKIFVDSLAEPFLFSFLKNYTNASFLKLLVDRYNVSTSKMKRYAKRRNQQKSLINNLNQLN